MTDIPRDEDGEIAVRAQQEPESFEALVTRYQQKLFLYILKYIHDEDIAKDVVQEAFIKMYINLRSYNPDKPFSAWAYRITHNEMVNYLRKNKQTQELNEEAQYHEMFDDRPDLTEEVDARINNEQMHKLIHKLPLKYREVLILHYFHNCDYQSIGHIISRPAATVGTRLKRAKLQLRNLYTQEYGDET